MKPITGRQERFTNGVISGLSAAESARRAGYGPAYSAKASEKLLRQPAIANAIQEAQVEIRKAVMFDAEQAFARCQELIQFAINQKNSMAAIKGHELCCKLAGLLVDRVQLDGFVDIGSALLEAKQRAQGLPISVASTAITIADHRAHDPVAGDLFS